jgi:hypothetical protein
LLKKGGAMKRLSGQMACALFGIVIISGIYRFNKVFAQGRTIKSTQRFRRILKDKELVAVLFYEKDNKKERGAMRGLKNTFNSLSKRYEDDVTFVTIDASRSNTAGLMDDYSISQAPTLLLFEDGHPVHSQEGAAAMLSGYASRSVMREFVDRYFGDRIEEIHAKKRREYKREQRRKERQREDRAAAYNASWNSWSYAPYGYPYGYSPYYRGYYGRPSFSFGVGFGSPWY